MAPVSGLENRSRPEGRLNAEAAILDRLHPLAVVDGDIDPERMARMRVRLHGEVADVGIHGSELYLTDRFDVSGGELILRLSLRKRNGVWTVTRTGEMTLAEYHERIKHR